MVEFKTKKYLDMEAEMAKEELSNCKKVLIMSFTANVILIGLILYLVNYIVNKG